MGVLDRLRGVGKLDQWAEAMRDEDARQRGLRAVLYTNPTRIADVSSQWLPNVVQTATGGELTAEMSAGVALVGAKASGKVSQTDTVEVTPLMQALMLEEAASSDGRLVDLDGRPGQAGDSLLRFVGDGRIVAPGQHVSALPEFGLTPDLAKRIETRRSEQELWLRRMDRESPGTLLLLACGAGPICSIATLRHADAGGLASYAHMPPFGILGLFEGRTEALTFVAPMIIWRDATVALDTEPSGGEPFTGLLTRPGW
jgi:hypothetical protein